MNINDLIDLVKSDNKLDLTDVWIHIDHLDMCQDDEYIVYNYYHAGSDREDFNGPLLVSDFRLFIDAQTIKHCRISKFKRLK